MMKKIKWIVIGIVILLLGIFSLWKGYYFFVQKPNIIVNDQGIFYIQAELYSMYQADSCYHSFIDLICFMHFSQFCECDPCRWAFYPCRKARQ